MGFISYESTALSVNQLWCVIVPVHDEKQPFNPSQFVLVEGNLSFDEKFSAHCNQQTKRIQ